ncbi:fimbria/pilus periplasmic chaperone [Trabulsiella odontotermitis]|uniref:fimbria/pilus periplasmic chaperone n=1 Tax=Trabulsiella odontotermitis TaxID=379893 RepID=UPI0006BA6DB5|nr:fimbria/pilus periplasmic chaperone [Trabulsiella odontotermitis]
MLRISTALAAVCLFAPACFAGGISLNATRVIYQEGQKEASLTVQNHSQKDVFLVQSWIDDINGNKKTPFIITPPLFQMQPNKNNALRIVNINNQLPADRESVYWINVKAIPSVSDDSAGKNLLQIAVRTRLKLFYRPDGLPGDPVSAAKTLTFAHAGNQLAIDNPSAYVMTFHDLRVGGKQINDSVMVPAKGHLSVKLPANTGAFSQVQYSIINDFGVAGAQMTQPVR